MKTIKKFQLSFAVVLFIFSFNLVGITKTEAGDPTFEWAKQFVGQNGGSNWANNIISDEENNIYTTGPFYGTVDFDPGENTYNLTSMGNRDIYITKIDSSGDFVWAKKMGGIGSDTGISLKINNSGDVITTGSFYGTADFDPGEDTYNLTSTGSYEIFISKLNSFSNFVWAKKIGGVGSVRDMVLDVYDNIYTTGVFYGTADFDPGEDTYNLTSNGSDDIFISKLDSSGDFVWAKKIEVSDNNWGASSISVDVSDNVYIVGSFHGTADFDPGEGIYNLTSTGSDNTFISKLDSSGNFVWAEMLIGSNGNYGYGISVDNNNNIIIAGETYGVVDMDPGAGEYLLDASVSGDDTFILKLYQDSTPPVITLLGPNEVNIYKGETYTDDGAIAIDDRDGDITESIVVVNNVNTDEIGEYTITYNVTDASGNNAEEVTRTVTVSKKPSSSGSSASSRYTNLLAMGNTTDANELLTQFPNQINPPNPSDGQATPNTPSTPTIPSTSSGQVTRTLKQTSTGDDVKLLQIYLNTHNFPVSLSGPGSPNNETNYFGKLTKQAVIKFQIANQLVGDGIVGPLTRSYIK